MLTNVCQRWRDHRSSYRPAGEPIDPRQFEVAEIADDKTAKAFVCGHHYSGSYPAARFRFGMYRGPELVGVAVFSHPASEAVLNCLPGAGLERTELGRFVLLDEVGGNGETWMMGRCFEKLRGHGIVGVVSFSDPMPRHLADGTEMFPGHVGRIYQAHNGVYLGRATARTLRLLPNGTVLSDRTLQKIRKRERGWDYASKQLVAFGATPLGADEDAMAWLATWMPQLTRRMRHPGNHRYAWGLDRRARKSLHSVGPYPKLVEQAA